MALEFWNWLSHEGAVEYFKGHSYNVGMGALAYDWNQISQVCHVQATAMGWYLDPVTKEPKARSIGEVYALIHSEISEGFEGVRRNLKSDKISEFTNEEEELADAIIRIADYCGAKELNVGGAIIAKLLYNQTREDHKLENRAKADGKKA